MQERPESGVIDVKSVARRILNDAGDHLRRLDGNLQRGNTKDSHHKSEESGKDQDGGCLQMFEYFVFRIMANPFRSSRMPSSSEKAGLYPVRSTFSFDTM